MSGLVQSREETDRMRISIFGLGYVGAVSLACLARDGHEVIGVDIDPSKLDLIRNGQTPIIEAGMDTLMTSVVASGRVQVTDDAVAALHASDLSFICVGTPSRPNGSQDVRALERLVGQLGDALTTKSAYHLFVVRSTVVPGTVDTVVIPLLEERSGRRCGRDFDVCFQPEFLREGSSIRDYDNPPYTIVGGRNDRAVTILRRVFEHLPGEVKVCDIRTAEMLKYACNAFHALKITFANEVGRICQAVEVDPHAVMDLVCQDRHLNISPAYLRPGFAFGGSCLPKDLRALCHLAGRQDVSAPMLSAIADSNRMHLDHAVALVLATGARSVGMLGLSFKSGTDDLRESPLVGMAERFIGKGLTVRIYDPHVHLSRLVGANRRYIEEVIPHLGSLMSDDLGGIIDQSQVVVVSLRTDEVVSALQAQTRPDHVVLDLANLPARNTLRGMYQGVCW
jgi:GDP-mannose 6-dehydrogenase